MATVLDLVKHYQHAIEKYTNDEQKVLKSIDKLFHLDVTVQHLQETGVGRTVNGLRKEPGDVGHAARALVYKWKLMVAAEESDQEGDHNTDTTYNGHENGKDADENAKQNSKNKYDCYEKSTPNVKSEHKELNGNYSGGKRKYHSSEDDDPDIKKRKGSCGNPPDDYKNKSAVQIKKEYSESEDESGDSGHTRSEDSDSDASQSSREDKKIMIKQEIKQEPTEKHQSSTLKHPSSYKSPGDEKREQTSSKKSHDSEKPFRRPESSKSPDKHSSRKSSSKDKSHSSGNHKSSRDKEKSDKNSKSENSSSEKDKKHKEDSKSSSKHKSSSDKHKSSSSENENEKHKSNHEKHSSKSDKHRSSSHSKSEKEKQKSSSEKEISEEKYKSKHSSSSKEKHSSSSKERSKDRSSSLKEKADSSSKETHQSHKSNRKQSSASDSKSKHSDSKRKSEKDEEGNSECKTKNKSSSSSSSHRSKSSSTKSTEDIPKKKNPDHVGGDSDDGIDCGSGASFAEALGMVSPAKPKKKPLPMKDSFSTSATNSNDLSPANLLASTTKLAPLPALEISALPEISPNYKPRPPPKLMPHFFSDEDLGTAISSKNQRTKVYSGNKVIGKIPSLYEMCVQILQEHIDALEYTGGVPYDILKPVVDRATPQQLFVLEHYNPYLMEDTDHLWQKFCEKNFRNKQRKEMETWREMYMRCQEEQEHRLKSLTANIRMTQEAKKAPIKQTKMAYVDSAVKPPRNVARKQAQHGTAHAASASPAARVAALAAGPGVLRGGARPSPSPSVPLSSSLKPKKAPLMQKALQFMRGRKR